MNHAPTRQRLCGLMPTNALLRRVAALLMTSGLTLLSACGGGGGGGSSFGDAFFLDGTVTNLAGGQLSLVNNGDTANAKTISANGSFRWPVSVPEGGSYNVTVGTQPTGQLCNVLGGHGSKTNIRSMQVICSSSAAAVSISGTVTGLATGSSLQLINNADTANTVSVAGSSSPVGFSFSQKIAANSSYAITVAAQPSGQLCQVSNASGAGATSNISNVRVNCAASTATTFSVGGAVQGLTSGSVTLLNNGDTLHPLTVSSNGTFSFAAPMVAGGIYAVSVSAQPTGQLCSVSKSSGVVSNANINSVAVTCASTTSSTNPGPVTVGGTVTGLTGTLTLLNNGDTANPAVITTNGAYSFPAQMSPGSSYAVTVAGQPAGQTCTVASRLSAAANNIVCAATTYTISGTVGGLTSGTVGFMVNGDTANAVVSGNGSFTFAVPVAAGSSYQISLATQPGGGQACGINNPLGSNVSANVSNVTVTCASATAVQTASPVVHSFVGAPTDVASPNPLLRQGPDGNLYGISNFGGANNSGGVYRMTPTGTTSLVYSFTSNEQPLDIAFGLDGHLYGLTYAGGSAVSGSVFRLTLAGVKTDLYSFTDLVPDVASALTLGPDGNLYGDGACYITQCAGIYKLNPVSGGLSQPIALDLAVFKTAYIYLSNLTLGYDGNFYGVSAFGGTGTAGVGCVFKVSPAGVVTCIYNFNGGVTPLDGSLPSSRNSIEITTLVQHIDGNLYGTINSSVFRVTPAGNYTLLYTFANANFDHTAGTSLVSGSDGNLYGVTQALSGGSPTLFQITPAGTVTTLYTFASNTVAPKSLTLGSDGYLYGATTTGGTANRGTVIKILP